MPKKTPPAAKSEQMKAKFDAYDPPDYVERSHQILAVERTRYLEKRRDKNGLPPPADDNLAGLCISGGGVRSATLGLGMLQAFIAKGILKNFDYLSTVSGGGYIGSCLSSLMSREPNNAEKFSNEPNRNRRFKAKDIGLEENDSPFAESQYDYEYQTLDKTKLNAKHQIVHLRRYGEYLTPRKGLFSWDVSRALGALTGGIVIHVMLFLLILGSVVLLHHALFASLSKGAFIDTLQHPQSVYIAENPDFKPLDYRIELITGPEKTTLEQIGVWYDNQLAPQFFLVTRTLRTQTGLVLIFGGIGALLGLLFIFFSRRIPWRVAALEQVEACYHDPAAEKMHERPGGDDLLRHLGQRFIRGFKLVAYFLGPILSYGATIYLAQETDFFQEQDYFVMLALPFSYSLGLFLAVQLAISLFFINNAPERVSGRLYRSFYTGMQGAAFLGVVISTLFPVLIILLFGDHGLVIGLLFSFLPVAAAYYFTMQSVGGRTGGSSWLNSILLKLQMPLLNLSILLFVGLALAWVSDKLFDLETTLTPDGGSRLQVVLCMLFLGIILVTVLGFAANSNDISLHYFYRDRLSEAYLRTEGRVAQPASKDPESTSGRAARPRSKDLYDVNLRNHENLRLFELGEDNFKGPYHLIVSALNLQGSHDLAKKTLKSDHFIFSKYFIGSRTTGYVRTDSYRNGGTKLSTAMAISAAAVASGMGMLSFAASNFYMTLFNLRTGYWIENPWYLNQEALEGKKDKGVLGAWWSDVVRRHPFWLWYLIREFTGLLSANTRRVYVSDGGHTGDNLGVLPLVQRRCRTIVIADFEEDQRYSFGSFNQAVRLAKAIYNADVQIDLKPLLPQKTEEGLLYSPASVAIGKIHYPAIRDLPAMEGQLVYMKSSISLIKEMSEITDKDVPPPITEPAPVFVLNYFKNNPGFPHQSTADQYFDEVQFEAHRMLGEHIGRQAAGRVRFY